MKKINWQYAFGEILIVIIGISIAFSMNKCAEIKKNNTQKKLYLENIKSDVKIDKNNLQKNSALIGQKIQTINEFIHLISNDDSLNGKSIFKLFTVFNLTEFYPKDITYQTMINSGDFKLIDNFELKAAIEEHYSNYKSILKDYERQEIIHKDYLGDYMIHNMDFEAMKKGQSGLKNQNLFKNILQSMNGSFLIKKTASDRGIKSCDNLLTILNKF